MRVSMMAMWCAMEKLLNACRFSPVYRGIVGVEFDESVSKLEIAQRPRKMVTGFCATRLVSGSSMAIVRSRLEEQALNELDGLVFDKSKVRVEVFDIFKAGFVESVKYNLFGVQLKGATFF